MIYIAKLSHGFPQIAGFEVVKETEKTVTVGKQANLLGYMYIANRLNKNEYAIFNSPEEACQHLIGLLENYEKDLLEKVKNTHGHIAALRGVVEG